jgi:hypothetical protein
VTTRNSCNPELWTTEQRVDWTREYLHGLPVELPLAEHDEGECTVCDTLRSLMREADDA